MSQKDDAGTEREQVPPSAVYRQLDDHLGPEEAPYDAESGLQRLRGWMGEEEPPDGPGRRWSRCRGLSSGSGWPA
jgi:hypothetical protein